MTLPEFVRTFWYSALELGQRAHRTPWGEVATDDRYPLVWDANNATVLEPAAGLTASSIRNDLIPALRAARAPYEHVEFWEEPKECPAVEELRVTGERPDPDVVMVLDRLTPPSKSTAVEVEEVSEPDSSFWPWYRESLREFRTAQWEDLLDQMTARTADVFVPAGMRFFVGLVEGSKAGYTSVLSLDGVSYLDNVVTMPAFRRRGVATATVSAAVTASRSRGDREVFLLAEKDGYPQSLYERLGFRVVTPIDSFTRLLTADPPSP